MLLDQDDIALVALQRSALKRSMTDSNASLADQELALAEAASDRETKIKHLDRAAVYAMRSKRERAGTALTSHGKPDQPA